MNNLQETDRKDQLLRRKGDTTYLRGRKKELPKGTKKYSFPQSSIDTWNGLKEQVIMANNVHQLKEKRDIQIWRQDHTSVDRALYTTTR